MADYFFENEIKHLLAKANLYDELGDFEQAAEIDDLVADLLERNGFERAAELEEWAQIDLEKIHQTLHELLKLRQALEAQDALGKLERIMNDPNIDPAQQQYVQQLYAAVKKEL